MERKVSLGSCDRAYGTSCHHEHTCLRCTLLRPDPDQADRFARSSPTSTPRRTEAEQYNWLGEVEGLKVSLIRRTGKLDEMECLTADDGPVLLGLPTIKRH